MTRTVLSCKKDCCGHETCTSVMTPDCNTCNAAPAPACNTCNTCNSCNAGRYTEDHPMYGENIEEEEMEVAIKSAELDARRGL